MILFYSLKASAQRIADASLGRAEEIMRALGSRIFMSEYFCRDFFEIYFLTIFTPYTSNRFLGTVIPIAWKSALYWAESKYVRGSRKAMVRTVGFPVFPMSIYKLSRTQELITLKYGLSIRLVSFFQYDQRVSYLDKSHSDSGERITVSGPVVEESRYMWDSVYNVHHPRIREC